jgi:hypothetical protein
MVALGSEHEPMTAAAARRHGKFCGEPNRLAAIARVGSAAYKRAFFSFNVLATARPAWSIRQT